jgi:hypothetical protein
MRVIPEPASKHDARIRIAIFTIIYQGRRLSAEPWSHLTTADDLREVPQLVSAETGAAHPSAAIIVDRISWRNGAGDWNEISPPAGLRIRNVIDYRIVDQYSNETGGIRDAAAVLGPGPGKCPHHAGVCGIETRRYVPEIFRAEPTRDERGRGGTLID